jgi:hypothetical protein
MRVRAQTSTGDYAFGGAGEFLIDSAEAVAQVIQQRLLLIAGEWFLDTNEGTEYYTQILGEHTQLTRELELRNRIQASPGVKEILSYAATEDVLTRKYTFFAEVDTVYGPVTVTL